MERALWLVIPAAQHESGGWIDDTLAQRADEAGLTARLDLAGKFPRLRVEVVRGEDAEEVARDLYIRRGWTDGLPIIPPTTDKVAAMVDAGGIPAKTLLATLAPLNGMATVERIAANAVMAGCRPDYFPVVLTAVRALAQREFNLYGVQTTDENVAPLLIVNGPARTRLELNSSFGLLGPGWRANATIGRAVRLIMHNLGGGWPAAVAFAGLGQPGRYTLCVAENEEQSPWAPLHVDQGLAASDSALTVMRAETCINITGELAEIASAMSSAASLFSVLHNGKGCVILAPATAASLAKDGWSKQDVQTWLWENGQMPTETWKSSWVFRKAVVPDQWPERVWRASETGRIPVTVSPEDITVIVAGGDVPIAQHAWLPSWGFPPCRITQKIDFPAPAP